jgi:hypothetical protein
MAGAPLEPKVVCNHLCGLCCDETIEELAIKGELALRNRAFTLSAITWTVMLVAHVGFACVGKVLPIPDMAWVVMLAPFGGAALSKVPTIFKGKP